MNETFVPDPELADRVLDLNRPELRALADRYLPRVALVVVGKSDPRPLVAALTEDGWRVETCMGPGRTRCPILQGKGRCDLRRGAEVTVVFVDGKRMWPGSGLLPRLSCAADASSPGVVALEDSVEPVSVQARQATVGALRAPGKLIQTIRRLVGPDKAPSPSGPASP